MRVMVAKVKNQVEEEKFASESRTLGGCGIKSA